MVWKCVGFFCLFKFFYGMKGGVGSALPGSMEFPEIYSYISIWILEIWIFRWSGEGLFLVFWSIKFILKWQPRFFQMVQRTLEQLLNLSCFINKYGLRQAGRGFYALSPSNSIKGPSIIFISSENEKEISPMLQKTAEKF